MGEPVYTQYRRSAIAEMTPWVEGFDMTGVSVSLADQARGCPRPGDMIARNPKNHNDKWLVAEAYFKDNFTPMEEVTDTHFHVSAVEAYVDGQPPP